MSTTENGYLRRYLEQNDAFARTAIIKIAQAAELINEGIIAKYGNDSVDIHRPETWKYYLNLAGQYHATDTVMSVVSIDTLETIDFTVENLAIHTATAKAHAYGTRHYYTLVYRYPEQEQLINSILCPVDITKAIAAPSGTILGYPDGLIEPNETSLVPELEQWLKNMIDRWFNAQFIMSDDLYAALFYTQMRMFVLPKLMNLRLKRCKTPEAHSFHIRTYLESHGRLDRYLPYMTLRQSLWLYRNICYIERNAGKTAQFVKLVEKLLTERGIPLAEYSLRHLDQFKTDFFPIAVARRKMLNVDQNVMSHELYSLDDVFDKEEPMADGNPIYIETYRDRDKFRIEAANSAVIQSKMLDSSMVDYSGSVPEPFEVVALREWFRLANANMYEVSISFKDVKTSEVRTMFAKDAFLYMYYIQLNSEGITFEEIPEYLNMQQRIHPRPTVETLLSVVPGKEHDLREIAELIVSRQPLVAPCFSVSSFHNYASKLTDEAYWHWFLISSTGDMSERAYVENMIKRLYEDVRVQFNVPHTRFDTWLQYNNLPAYDFSKEEADGMVKSIFEASTGLVVDGTRSLKAIQAAMIGLMTELSSYSIQITTDINEDNIIAVNWPSVRWGFPNHEQADRRMVECNVFVLDSSGEHHAEASVVTDIDSYSVPFPAVTSFEHAVEIDPTTTQESLSIVEVTATDIDPTHYADITYDGQNVELENAMFLPGYTSFDTLPETYRERLRSNYQSY